MLLAGWMGVDLWKRSSKNQGTRSYFFYIVAILLNSFGDPEQLALDLVIWFRATWFILERRWEMKKKHLLLLLGSLLLGGLIGMFGAAFTNLHLNISQEQVQFV